ncbi:MAG: L-aspartate oxidase [Crocinitomicaceae bacterium]|nr:L-aspartate oxidase [Crocinitomicaceae bacterium]
MRRQRAEGQEESDILIIGGGIGGLAVAIHLTEMLPDKKITLISKDKPGESNSIYAQGGIAAVMNTLTDSFEKHIADTLRTGDGLSNPQVVEMVVRDAPERLRQVMEWGAAFDQDDAGNMLLGLEGGHSSSRIVHAKDKTGFVLVNALLKKLEQFPHVCTQWQTLVVDLLFSNDPQKSVCGVKIIHKHSTVIQTINAPVVILATGGSGQVYPLTTNPSIATGDGVAMAFRMGASISNMEFVQFHPTALHTPTAKSPFLISEAVRGAGAYLVTSDGNRFMFAYDNRAELAPRDIVARAIYSELKKQQTYLDCRHLPADRLIQDFPMIYSTCLSYGFDLTKDLIPVTPAAHYQCGGIETDGNGRTSIHRLYAIGECACTGLHGANRLASNSLIEALVFAFRCASDISHKMQWEKIIPRKLTMPNTNNTPIPDNKLLSIQGKMKECMADLAGIVRSTESLRKGLHEIEELKTSVEHLVSIAEPNWLLFETRNLLTVAMLIFQQSLEQKQNKGTFYNIDFTKTEKTGRTDT